MISSPPPSGAEPPATGGKRPWTALWDRLRHPANPTPVRVAVLLFACYLTGFAVNNLAGSPYDSGLGHIFPRIVPIGGSRLDTSSLQTAWGIIQDNYVRRGVSATTAQRGAEQGLMAGVQQRYDDRFSAYLTPDQYTAQQQRLKGQQKGAIGISLEERCAGGVVCPAGQTASLVAIAEVYNGQPAANAGIRRGDVVEKVDGAEVSSLASTLDKQLDAVAVRIHGSAGSSVSLTLLRPGGPLDIRVQRANLSLPSVFTQHFGGALYLQLTSFDQGSGDEVKKRLKEGLNSATTAVILDLRHNPGGFVTDAQKIASQFLQKIPGKQDAVVIRRGRMDATGDPQSAQQVTTDSIENGGVALAPKLVVLVDGNSASAAEIVTAALHDYHRATVIGERTFGKGSVQTDFSLPDGSDLHLTIELWYGPNGESIEGHGIDPDAKVVLPDDDHRFRLDASTAEAAQDAQLQAALTVAQQR